LAGVGGFVLGGVGAAIEGTTMGFQGMVRGLLPAIVVAVGAIAILHLNPVTVVPALLIMGILRSFRGGDILTKKARTAIGGALREKMLETLPDQSREVALRIDSQLESSIAAVDAAMEREMESVREQVSSVLEIRRSGADAIEADRLQIAEVESRLHRLDSSLSEFIRDLTGTPTRRKGAGVGSAVGSA
jgi:hypothetical protein